MIFYGCLQWIVFSDVCLWANSYPTYRNCAVDTSTGIDGYPKHSYLGHRIWKAYPKGVWVTSVYCGRRERRDRVHRYAVCRMALSETHPGMLLAGTLPKAWFWQFRRLDLLRKQRKGEHKGQSLPYARNGRT